MVLHALAKQSTTYVAASEITARRRVVWAQEGLQAEVTEFLCTQDCHHLDLVFTLCLPPAEV